MLAHRQIRTRVRATGEGEAQRVGAVIAHPIHRVDAVAQGLGHLAAVLVADEAVEEDILERHLRAPITGSLVLAIGLAVQRGALERVREGSEHHHAGDPEEQNVVASNQHGGWVEFLQVRGVLRPTHRGERPQGGAEPGVQHVLVLAPALPRRRLVVRAAAHDLAFRPVPDRDTVAPPQLAGNGPVVHAIHPVEPAWFLGGRVDGRIALSDGVAGHLRQLLHVHPPLQGKPRFDRLAGALGVADGVHVGVLAGHHAALLLEGQADLLAGFEAVHAIELGARTGNVAGLVEHHRHRQVVALPHREVVRIVRRGDLHRTGAELRIHVVIRDDHHLAVRQEWVRQRGADEVGVALVLRVHRDGHVTQHRFHAGGRDDDVGLVVVEGTVTEADQLALDVLVVDLDVGDGGLQHRRPVDHPVGLVDHALVEQGLEDRLDGAGQALVQGEAFAGPVHGVANGAHLLLDQAAVFVLPLPDALDELLAAVIKAVLRFALLQVGFHAGLSGDTCVVGARQPQDLVALHTAAAGHRVDQGVIQRVAHVQPACDVRRRQDDGERRLIACRIGLKVAGRNPALIELRFHIGWVPLIGQQLRTVLAALDTLGRCRSIAGHRTLITYSGTNSVELVPV